MVDELREYPHVRLPFKHWCHLVSDGGFEELHAFAAQLGIPRHRFQGDHYDLPPGAAGPPRPLTPHTAGAAPPTSGSFGADRGCARGKPARPGVSDFL